MKAVSRIDYKCDYCDMKFNDPSECEQHEKEHVKCTEIESQGFQDGNFFGCIRSSKYPAYLIVKMEDGEKKKYFIDGNQMRCL